MHLSNKVALVTGAGHGIGRTIAKSLAAAGAKIVVNYPFERQEATELVREIESLGREAIAIEADISDSAARNAMFGRAIRQFGALHILVNNAAYDPGPTDPLEVDEEFFDQIISVNLKAAFFCAQSAARAMIQGKIAGRIINISSIQGQQSVPRHAPYSITKGGINAMTRQLAVDLGPHGITVNAIAPGFVEVARTVAHFEDYEREKVAQQIPIRRVGMPSDVAALACFLAAEESGYLTGQVIPCDGGQTARMSFGMGMYQSGK
jgi:NAD(P)-dependent dehydrogenase (short-subunit alcohol dehydrogenase family)